MSTVKNSRKRKCDGTLCKDVKPSKTRKLKVASDDELAAEHAQLLDSVTGQIKRLLPFEEEDLKEDGVEGNDDSVGKESERESAKGVNKSAAAEYLLLWDTDRKKWSFKKKTQYWLLQNMYDKKKVSKSSFKLMTSYLDGLRGRQREVANERAMKVMAKNETERDKTTESRTKFKRAVKVVRVLAPLSS